ncbi:hypothetical protein PCASD_18689 [Puccinia coronata f. sp. avenae]|uniref:Uncharacterized protein n=1 Tax=Puccinia coronata f. sp. avenae TaxID=200324 RepID=A0A2N5U0T6_9BASI|nr:hypothetical protein PCASD_18689 [Puccinia coronata f. sp. avenae]
MDAPPEYEDKESSSEDESPPSPAFTSHPSRPQQLFLHLGPHPTQVTSSIDLSKILARCTLSAFAFSVSSVEPANHSQAMLGDDKDQWATAELK